jgi:hypothetical protein
MSKISNFLTLASIITSFTQKLPSERPVEPKPSKNKKDIKLRKIKTKKKKESKRLRRLNK